MISVPETSRILTLKDLIDAGKAGRSFTYASCGAGTPQHLAGGMLEISARISLQHIAYKGCAPAITDVLAGQVEMGINTLANTVPHVTSKKLRALAVTSKRRTPQLPDVPAVSGQMGYNTANVGPDEFQKILVADIERFGKVTRSIGLSLDN